MDTSAAERIDSPVQSDPVPVKLAHVVLRTSQFNKLLEWYGTVFLTRTSYANDMVAFLTYDDEHHRIAILNAGQLGKSPEMYVGVDHVAFTYGDLTDLLHNWDRLKKLGIEPFWCINHGPTTSMYYRDPDDNEIELQVDNFETFEEATGYFGSEAFASNPIGVDFDPGLLLSKLREGVPVSELLKQGSAPVAKGQELKYDRLSKGTD